MTAGDNMKRIALDKLVDYIMKDPQGRTDAIMDMLEPLLPTSLFPEQRKAFRSAFEQKNNWYQLIMKVLGMNEEVMPDLVKTFLVEANFLAWPKQEEARNRNECNIPWAILLDPTSACNLRCTGCWAAEYGHKLNLSFDDIDSIIKQGKELGVHVYIYTGGEPLVRKKDLIALCEKHPDCAFLCFTNATLIDEEFCQDMIRVKNFVPAISAEGSKETTDARRGEGTYDKIAQAMALLKKHRLPYGISACYTSQNAEAVASEEYFDWMIEQGALFCWIFTYMPVGTEAVVDLMPSVEQRRHLYDFVREMRQKKPLFTLDFQNDGEFVGGCIAGGRRYLHINAQAMWSLASSCITPTPTFMKHRFSKRSSRRCSWPITATSRSTTISCAPAPCSKTPMSSKPWWKRRTHDRPTCSTRKARTISVRNAGRSRSDGPSRPRRSGIARKRLCMLKEQARPRAWPKAT